MSDREKALALWADLLERWQEAEEFLIYEMSGNIAKSIAEMKADAEMLDAEFKKAMGGCEQPS